MKLLPESEDTSNKASVSNMEQPNRGHANNQNGHPQQRPPFQKPRTTSGNYGHQGGNQQGPPPPLHNQQQQQTAMQQIPQQMTPYQMAQVNQMNQIMQAQAAAQFGYAAPYSPHIVIAAGQYPGGPQQQMGPRVQQGMYGAQQGQPMYYPQQIAGYQQAAQNFNQNYGGGVPPGQQGFQQQNQNVGSVESQGHPGGGAPRHPQPRMSAPGESAGFNQFPSDASGPPPRFTPGPNAPVFRQPSSAVVFGNVQNAAGGVQTQAPSQPPLVKRERKPLVFINPDTAEAVETVKPPEVERRASVDSTTAPSVTLEGQNSASDAEPRTRSDSTSKDESAQDARAKFARKIAQLTENTAKKSDAPSSAADGSGKSLPASKESTPVRAPIVMSAPSDAREVVSGSASPRLSVVARILRLRSRRPVKCLVPQMNVKVPSTHQKPLGTVMQVRTVKEMAPTTRAQPALAAFAAASAPKNSELLVAKSSPKVFLLGSPPKKDSREPLKEHRLEEVERRNLVWKQQDGGKEESPVVNGEKQLVAVSELDVLEKAAKEKPVLAGRLVYDRNALLALEKSIKDLKLSDKLKKQLDVIWKSSLPAGAGQGQGNRGGNQAGIFPLYGPLLRPLQTQGGQVGSSDTIHYISFSNCNMQDNQPRPPEITILRSSASDSNHEPPQSSVNAWKPVRRRIQTEVAEDEKTLGMVRELLNKITPDNYEKLSATMLTLPFTETPELLLAAVNVIFEKAVNDANYSEMYAKLCCKLIDLESKKPDQNGRPVKFRRVLLNHTPSYFEKTDKNAADTTISPAEAEEKRVKAKRRHIGSIGFISELYQHAILTDRVILICLGRFLPKKPDFSDINEDKLECLCRLLMTCSQSISSEYAPMCCDQLKRLIATKATSSRTRFLMQETIDFKNNGFVGRNNNNFVLHCHTKPKTLQEAHKKACHEDNVLSAPPLTSSDAYHVAAASRWSAADNGSSSFGRPSWSDRSSVGGQKHLSSCLPADEQDPDITTEEELQDATRLMVEAVKKTEEVIGNSLVRMKQPEVKQRLVSQLFSHYCEATKRDRRSISALLVALVKNGRLPSDVLQASLAELVELTQEQVMDLGTGYYRDVVGMIGPLVVEQLLSLSWLTALFRKGTKLDVTEYDTALREWLKDPENLSTERRQKLLSHYVSS